MMANSSGVNLFGDVMMLSGMPILPTSCMGAAYKILRHIALRKTAFFGDERAVAAHADDMLARELVFVFHGQHQALHGIVVGFLQARCSPT